MNTIIKQENTRETKEEEKEF